MDHIFFPPILCIIPFATFRTTIFFSILKTYFEFFMSGFCQLSRLDERSSVPPSCPLDKSHQDKLRSSDSLPFQVPLLSSAPGIARPPLTTNPGPDEKRYNARSSLRAYWLHKLQEPDEKAVLMDRSAQQGEGLELGVHGVPRLGNEIGS